MAGAKFHKRFKHKDVAVDFEFRALIELLNKYVDSQQALMPNLPPGPNHNLLMGSGDGPVTWLNVDLYGDVSVEDTGLFLKSGAVYNSHIATTAAIAVSKIALGTNKVIVGSSGVGSEVAKTTITLDEWGAPAANIPMNSKKLTGLSAGSSNGDSIRYEQHNVSGLTDVGALSLTEGALFYYNGSAFVLVQRPTEVLIFGQSTTWTNMPAAVTEIFGATILRTIFDTTSFKQFRIHAKLTTAGFAGSKIRLEYSTNSGSSWANAEDTTTTGDLAVDTTTVQVGTWVNLVSAAKASSVWFRIVGLSGDGVVDPVFLFVKIHFR